MATKKQTASSSSPPHLLLVAAVLALFLGQGEGTPYPGCTDPEEKFKGYTFSVDQSTGGRAWSHCGFPNPRFDHGRCGLPPSPTQEYFICDPDHIVTNDVAVDGVLKTVQSNTSTVCQDAAGNSQSFIVALALIDKLRVPNLSSPNRCENDCGEVRPLLNVTSRAPSSEEVSAAMAAFGQGLRAQWGMGACQNDVIVLYCRQHNAVYTSVGSRAATTLTSAWLSSMESTLLGYANEGRLEEGLLLIAHEFRTNLRGLAPAFAILLLQLIFLVLFILFVVFFLHLNDLDLNVWGYEKQWKLLENVVLLVTGVWLIHAIFLSMARAANAIPLWLAAVFALCSAVCVAIFVLEDYVFPETGLFQRLNI